MRWGPVRRNGITHLSGKRVLVRGKVQVFIREMHSFRVVKLYRRRKIN